MRTKRGARKSDVLAALRDAETPPVTTEVQKRLDDSPAHATVVTTLPRPHHESVPERVQPGKAFAHRSPFGQPVPTTQRRRRVFEGEDDRNQVIARLRSQLSEKDERMPRSLSREHGGLPPCTRNIG